MSPASSTSVATNFQIEPDKLIVGQLSVASYVNRLLDDLLFLASRAPPLEQLGQVGVYSSNRIIEFVEGKKLHAMQPMA